MRRTGRGVVVTTVRGWMAHAEAELEHVPGFGVAPGGQLVAPGRMELGPAEAVGFVGGEGRGDDAVGPGEASLGRLVGGALVGVANGEDAAVALDHDVASIGGGRGDEGNAADVVGFATWARTHSAPVRVLPQPRPARTSQTSQSPPWGKLGGAGPRQSRPTPGFQPLPGPAWPALIFLKFGLRPIAIATLEFRSLHPHPSSGLTSSVGSPGLGGRTTVRSTIHSATAGVILRQGRRLITLDGLVLRAGGERVQPACRCQPGDSSTAGSASSLRVDSGAALCAVGGHPGSARNSRGRLPRRVGGRR